MSNFVHRMLGHYFLAEADDGQGGGGNGGGDGNTPAPESLLSQSANSDYIPEKYRVTKGDGSLDLEQSSRKLAESYTHLEKRLGTGDAPPKTAEEYAPKIEVDGFDWEDFKADESSQSFLKGAHAKGLTNAQVEFVLGEYLKAAPNLIEGSAILSSQDCTTALKTVWADDQQMQTNLGASFRAASAFANETGIGSFESLNKKFGTDPDFIAFAANIGKELREDLPVNGVSPISEEDFSIKAAGLRKQLEELPAHDPKRAAVMQQLDGMYASRYSGSKFK